MWAGDYMAAVAAHEAELRGQGSGGCAVCGRIVPGVGVTGTGRGVDGVGIGLGSDGGGCGGRGCSGRERWWRRWRVHRRWGNGGLGECILIIFCWGGERERRGWCQWEFIL